MASLTYDTPTLYDTPLVYDPGGGPPPPPPVPDPIVGCFTPPAVLDNPPYLPTTPVGPALSLFRHYTPRFRGVNVFLLSDGTYVQDTATPENDNTNIPYPYDPYNNPPIPFARIYDFKGNETDVSQDPYIVKVYYGGRCTDITQSEANSLIAAGYGNDLTIPPNPPAVAYRSPVSYRGALTYRGLEPS